MRAPLLLASLALLTTGSPGRACTINEAGSSDVGMSIYMRVAPGEGCSFPITPPSRFGSATIISLTMVQRAAHGRAGVAGRSGIAYVARPDYQGPDSFSAQLVVDRNGTRDTGVLQFRVDVAR